MCLTINNYMIILTKCKNINCNYFIVLTAYFNSKQIEKMRIILRKYLF